jgi:hypothetical protein
MQRCNGPDLITEIDNSFKNENEIKHSVIDSLKHIDYIIQSLFEKKKKLLY